MNIKPYILGGMGAVLIATPAKAALIGDTVDIDFVVIASYLDSADASFSISKVLEVSEPGPEFRADFTGILINPPSSPGNTEVQIDLGSLFLDIADDSFSLIPDFTDEAVDLSFLVALVLSDLDWIGEPKRIVDVTLSNPSNADRVSALDFTDDSVTVALNKVAVGEALSFPTLTFNIATEGETVPNPEPETVPEPASILGLAAIAGISLATRRKSA
jgi:hypothetical protein